jgi:hypothetical protein
MRRRMTRRRDWKLKRADCKELVSKEPRVSEEVANHLE